MFVQNKQLRLEKIVPYNRVSNKQYRLQNCQNAATRTVIVFYFL